MKFLIALMLILGGLELCAQDFSILGKWQSKDFGQTTIFHFKADSTVEIISGSDSFNTAPFRENIAVYNKFTINTIATPFELDFITRELITGVLVMKIQVIFKPINGGQFMMCYNEFGEGRPTTLVTKSWEHQFCLTFKRIP